MSQLTNILTIKVTNDRGNIYNLTKVVFDWSLVGTFTPTFTQNQDQETNMSSILGCPVVYWFILTSKMQ